MAIALLATAGALGLFESTETRYAEIAREMVATGDWLVPRLDGIPHWHKPPLAYWTVAAGLGALGANAWGARVPMTLLALATLLLAVIAARRRFASLAIPDGIVAWTLGGSFLFLALSRSVASDPVLACSVAAFWALAPSPWALAALGAGFLAKGPVVFIHTVLPVLIAAAWARDRSLLGLLGPRQGWLWFAAVALPWYLVVIARTPGLFDYLVVGQIWQRYASETHHRAGSPLYFVAVMLAGALPWTPALIAGIGRLWKERASKESKLLLAWLIAPVVFLSFSGSKLPAYVLPCFPAAALIAARALERPRRWVAWSSAALLLALAIAGWSAGPLALAKAVGTTTATLPAAVHVALVCLLGAATMMLGRRVAAASLLVLFAYVAAITGLAPFEGPLGSPRLLVRLLRESRGSGEPVVEYLRFNAGVPFYLGERVRLLDVPRETSLPDPTGGFQAFVTRDSLLALAARHGRVWILGPRQRTAELADSLGLGYQPMATWRKNVLGVLTP